MYCCPLMMKNFFFLKKRFRFMKENISRDKILVLRGITAISLMGAGIINEQTLDRTSVQFGTLKLINMNIGSAAKSSKRQTMSKKNMRITHC